MKCPECLDLLQRRLDGEALPPLPDLPQHLAHCPTCREQHLAAQALLDGLHHIPVVPPPADLGDRVVTWVLEDRQRRRRHWRYRLSITVALAASLLLMAILGYWGLPQPAPDPDKNLGAQVVPKPDAGPDSEAPLQKSVDEARLAVANLTESLAEKTKEQAKLLLAVAPPLDVDPMTALPEVTHLQEPLAPAAESLRHTGQGMSEGLQIVGRSATRAVDYFMRELAPMDFGPAP